MRPSKECVWRAAKGGTRDWHYSSEVFLVKLSDYKVCIYYFDKFNGLNTESIVFENSLASQGIWSFPL